MVKKTIAMMLVIMLAYTMLPWAGVPTGFTVARAADTTVTIGAWSEDVVDSDVDTMLELWKDSDPSPDDKDVWLSGDVTAGYVLHVEEKAVLQINGTINVPGRIMSFTITGGGKIVWTGNDTGPMFKLSEGEGANFITLDITIDGGNGTGALISVPHFVSNGWTITVGRDPFVSSRYDLTTFENNRGPAIEVTKGAYPMLQSEIHLHNAKFDGVKAVAAASGLGKNDAIDLRIYPDTFTQSTTIDLSGLQRSQIETVYPDYDGGMNLVEGDENSSDPNPQIVTIIPWSGAEKGDLFGEIGDENSPDGDTIFNYPRLAVDGFVIDEDYDECGYFYLKLGAKKSDGNGDPGQSDPGPSESAPVFWPVTVTYGEGGTAWASAETVENGGSVEITAQPYDYYTVADVKVNGESVGAVSSYTIENITGPVAVDVSFRHANSFIDEGGQDERDDSESESDLGWGAGYAGQSLLFGDVYPWHPAYSAISFVAERGLMNGVGSGLFDPDNGVTRAMMATILWRMEGQPAAYGDTGFSDVPAGQWYSQAITWANRAGIIEGYGKGIYGLNDQVTHEQVCAMLYRWHSGGYATVDAAYAWAQSNGMYDGMSAESDEIATRGEIAQLLMAFAVRVW